MRYLDIGNAKLSVIGLGTWQFGTKSWGWDRQFGLEDAYRIVHRALDLGINVIDTAELYSNGNSERIIGVALKNRRPDAFLATKVSPWHATRGSVKRAAYRSQHRLGVDSLDLYQVHWPNPLIPLSSTMAGMRDLQNAGIITHVGVSNYNLSRWIRAEKALGAPIITNQVLYHLLDRAAEEELIPYANRNGRVVIAYSPLAQGLLAGNYTVDRRPDGVRNFNSLFDKENLQSAEPTLSALKEIAKNHNAKPSQIALAWLIRHPNVIVIPGAKSINQLEENVAAADIKLHSDEIQVLEEVSSRFEKINKPWRYALKAARQINPLKND